MFDIRLTDTVEWREKGHKRRAISGTYAFESNTLLSVTKVTTALILVLKSLLIILIYT